MTKKKTVGQASTELLQKQTEPQLTHTIEEQTQEQLHDYLDNLIEAVSSEVKRNPSADFFVVVLSKKEQLLKNVIRNYFFARQTCPTPTYDQAVYHYSHADQSLKFIWVVPAQDVCCYFLDHPDHAETPAEQELVGFINDFSSRRLDALQAKLNGKEEKIIIPIS